MENLYIITNFITVILSKAKDLLNQQAKILRCAQDDKSANGKSVRYYYLHHRHPEQSEGSSQSTNLESSLCSG
jgi:hypothetical protein